LQQEARPRVEPDGESHPVRKVPRVPSEVLEDPAVEELDELVRRVRKFAGGPPEGPLILPLGIGRHDPVGQEAITGELVEPPARGPDATPHRAYELVHRPGE